MELFLYIALIFIALHIIDAFMRWIGE